MKEKGGRRKDERAFDQKTGNNISDRQAIQVSVVERGKCFYGSRAFFRRPSDEGTCCFPRRALSRPRPPALGDQSQFRFKDTLADRCG